MFPPGRHATPPACAIRGVAVLACWRRSLEAFALSRRNNRATSKLPAKIALGICICIVNKYSNWVVWSALIVTRRQSIERPKFVAGAIASRALTRVSKSSVGHYQLWAGSGVKQTSPRFRQASAITANADMTTSRLPSRTVGGRRIEEYLSASHAHRCARTTGSRRRCHTGEAGRAASPGCSTMLKADVKTISCCRRGSDAHPACSRACRGQRLPPDGSPAGHLGGRSDFPERRHQPHHRPRPQRRLGDGPADGSAQGCQRQQFPSLRALGRSASMLLFPAASEGATTISGGRIGTFESWLLP